MRLRSSEGVGAALTEASVAEAAAILAERDPYLASLVDRHGPPPLWPRPPGFATLVRIILEQQVSLASAAALFARLQRELGDPLSPAAIILQGPAGLRDHGLTRQKAHYVSSLAAQVEAGELVLSHLGEMTDRRAATKLMRVPGIGPWTASIYLLMALRRPDVWPSGDLALHRVLARHHRRGQFTAEQAVRIARRWRPWRAVAARILWHSYLSEGTAGAG